MGNANLAQIYARTLNAQVKHTNQTCKSNTSKQKSFAILPNSQKTRNHWQKIRYNRQINKTVDNFGLSGKSYE
ncbi:hypothetical protein B0181_01050 [Moraxella caviae]|uniref:Uncharacterized protein n=1 Tax=Moraxella caviae TaxID=34060 RepID=A0A1T0AB54_9GAMM|nr:hypothetical protein B0181_01050 [Moraxella caviae]